MIVFKNSSDNDGLEITCTGFPWYSITGLEPVTQSGWQGQAPPWRDGGGDASTHNGLSELNALLIHD